VDGEHNIAIGDSAASNANGGFNTVIGDAAGQNLINGFDNIYIGETVGNGVGDESGTIRIGFPKFTDACFIAGITGVPVSGDPVVVDGNGKLGVAPAGHPLSMNELLKEHKKVEEQQASIADLKATVAQQQKGMDVLTAQLKEQAAQIQKVSAQLQVSKAAPQTVLNSQ
jgi:hypothetical protein